jgi:hypothetical protein
VAKKSLDYQVTLTNLAMRILDFSTILNKNQTTLSQFGDTINKALEHYATTTKNIVDKVTELSLRLAKVEQSLNNNPIGNLYENDEKDGQKGH